MKKTILYAAIIGAIGLSSCKKEMTCTCTSTYTDYSGKVTTSEPSVTTYKKVKKGDAKDKCISGKYESSYSVAGTTYTEKSENKCELK